MNIRKLKYFLPIGLSDGWRTSALQLRERSLDGKAVFRAIAIGVVVLGIIFRLGNLSNKPYWEDEVFTSTLIAGYEMETIEAELANKLVAVSDLSKYQDVQLGQSWLDTTVALAKRPEHTPLYFLLARVWAQCFGSSEIAMRAFPAVSSLLTLPLFYWLSFLLFDSSEIALATLCLASTSPIFIRYAQDARPYSLWVVGMLLSSSVLLWAVRRDRLRHWGLYGISVAFAGLTHWLSGFVFLAHSVYMLATRYWFEKSERVKVKRFFVALGGGLLLLAPWLGLVIYGRYSVRAVLSWLEQEETLGGLMMKWLGNVSHLVFAQLPQGYSGLLFSVPLLLLITWSAARTVVEGKARQWILPVSLCLIPVAAFVVPDLLFGGTRSLISRYFLPADIGALLILGFGLGANLFSSKGVRGRSSWHRQILFYAVLTVSISACWFNFNAVSWWGSTDFNRQMATSVLRTSDSVEVYSDRRLSPFLAFSRLLRPTDYVAWLDSESSLPEEAFSGSRTAFLYEPSDALLAEVDRVAALKGMKVDLVERGSKLSKPNSNLLKLEQI